MDAARIASKLSTRLARNLRATAASGGFRYVADSIADVLVARGLAVRTAAGWGETQIEITPAGAEVVEILGGPKL